MKSDNLPRPTVLTPEVQAIILGALSDGNYLVTACDIAGISYSTLLYWRQKHEANDPVAEPFVDFLGSIKRAVALGEAKALRELKQGDPGWQAKAWFLERRFSKRWGKKDQVVISKPDAIQTVDADDADAFIAAKSKARETK